MENAVFEGISGALSLSVIAFSIVFLVLLGLTVVIFTIRLFVSFKKEVQSPGGSGKPSQMALSQAAVMPPLSGSIPSKGLSPELVAAISGVLIAKLGNGTRILSVQPARGEGLRHSWLNWGRFDGLQGLDRSAWTAGNRKF
ncbi:MAG: hypothetical protein CSA35_03200 [Dethiosulfovibrio peptidovorans]|nr:MAG: hypothetical protein CSA35_03200 [Dethiosulfovibrio peptidovorans]